jgi:HSP20 family protein
MRRDLMPFGDDPFFSGFFNDPFPFTSVFGQGFPKMDMEETEKDVIVTMELPGVDPKDVEIGIHDNHLIIAGKTDSAEETKEKHYFHKERRSGAFRRQIPLPTHVDLDKIKAKAKDGILTITLPKVDSGGHKMKKIPIEG